MKFTSEMVVRLRDIFDEKVFSVQNWMHSNGRSRIEVWLENLGVIRTNRDCLPYYEPGFDFANFVFLDCRFVNNQLLAYDLLVPLDLAEKILVLGDIPSEKSPVAR